MKPKPDSLPVANPLRNRAELQLRRQPAEKKPGPGVKRTHADTQRLLHELQVHQIELELQNEELQKARDEMEAGLEQYSDLYDFAPVSYFTLTARGVILQVNLTGATLVGIERSRLVGQSFGQLVAAESGPGFNSFLKQVFAVQTKHSGEFILLRRGQSPCFVAIEAKRPANGQECRVVVVDITERKRAVDEVRLSEIRYRRLFEAAHDGVLLVDPATRKISDANPFMTKLLGYPRDQLVGKELFEIGLLKDEGASQEMFQKLKRKHEVRYEDLPLKSQHGRHQEVEVVANLYQENGRSVIQCNIRDITARKQAEDALRRSEALFSSLIAQAPVGVYVVDAEFRMQQVNPTAREVFKNVHPLEGRDFAEILHVVWPKPVADQVLKHFRHTLRTGEPYKSPEFAQKRKDLGTDEVYEWQIQRVTLPVGEYGVVCFFSNITMRKQAEAVQRRLDILTASNEKLKQEIVRREASETALKQSEEHALRLLEQSRKLQKKLRHFSHQILQAQENQRKEISRELHDKVCQLLVGINVHLEVFASEAASNPQGIRRAMAPMRELVEKSVKIVHQFARELRPASLDDLGLIPSIRSYIADFPKQKGRQIEFAAYAGVEALGNDKQTVLYRVVQEALTNVAKHAQASVVNVTILKAPDGVCLEIADNGKSFEVSCLSAAPWGGRLGLIGMRERVEMVGGRFTVLAVPGQGTTIRAELSFEEMPPPPPSNFGSPQDPDSKWVGRGLRSAPKHNPIRFAP